MSEQAKPLESALEELLRRIVREEIRAAMGELNGQGEDRMLGAKEAARLLGVERGWLYKRHAKLPFAVKIHHRMLRFSSMGIQRYIAAKKVEGRS